MNKIQSTGGETMTATDDNRTMSAEFPHAAISHAMNYGAEAMRALTHCQGKSPMEVIDVWAEFYRRALEDYAAHARSLTLLGQEALEEAVRETEVEAAEAAAAISKSVEEATGIKAVADSKTRAA
jgi:hypothetical protein